MRNYKIFTDSVSDLPLNLIRELDLRVVSLKYEIGGKAYTESINENRSQMLAEFYSSLKMGASSKTSLIPVGEFISEFQNYLEKDMDVLYIAFSSGLSGTYNSACLAAKELEKQFPGNRVRVIDSLCASLGEGLLVYESVIRKREGMDIDSLEKWINNNKLRVCHLVLLEDLKHLKTSGRISFANELFGSLLGIRPIVKVDNEGKLIAYNKQRGRAKALDFIANEIRKTGDDISSQTIFISYSQCKDEAVSFGEKIKSDLGVKGFLCNEIGTVIGSHAGCGVIAVFFFGKKR
ncbi:MAG: DegV family protein [Oscillospiraceae bacterium]|jgi:DegV family protein with EDD domain|nr:DegV family protein [Oscillospiraceae bacterium]